MPCGRVLGTAVTVMQSQGVTPSDNLGFAVGRGGMPELSLLLLVLSMGGFCLSGFALQNIQEDEEP